MDFKRLGSALIGLPLVALILLFGNELVISIFICVISIICMYEYLNAVSKKANPIKWIGYLSCFAIITTSFLSIEILKNALIIAIPTSIVIMFLQLIGTDMKTNFNDIVYTILGMIYIIFFLIFLPLIRNLDNGKILIWYPIIAAWGTDIFAYIFGKRIGKHKFSKVSPNKSVEGCLIGTIGAIILFVLYTYINNKYLGTSYSYIYMSCIALVLSLIGQIGDFAASGIKRFADIKDFGEIIPGHGGMLDRVDSLLFIAPFAYMLLSVII